MKQLSVILLIFFSSFLNAQNWSPVLVNEKMNYKHSDSSYISHTLWVDSTSLQNSDSIYYFNRIVKVVQANPELGLRNQAQFLLKQMVKNPQGKYIFQLPGEMIIKSHAALADSWFFDEENEITATVSSIALETIFGVQDSVKIISLSNDLEIRLSKSFGILEFPDFENGGHFELVGVQNTEYGESIPDFWDIYNFEIGDVFQYDEYFCDINFTKFGTRKFEIVDKELVGNTMSYSYQGVYSAFGYGNKSWDAYPISGEYTFQDSSRHIVNSYPNQLQIMPYCEGNFGSGEVFASSQVFRDDETDKLVKQFGIYFGEFPIGSLYYALNDISDTLFRYPTSTLIDMPAGLKGLKYSESLGQIYSGEGIFEYEDWSHLEGYVKDGDTVGSIIPDSVLLSVSINESQIKNDLFHVYPNPSDDLINIKWQNPNSKQLFDLEIRNIYGQMILEEKDIQASHYTLNLSDRESGVYFYLIKQDGIEVQQGKLIKN